MTIPELQREADRIGTLVLGTSGLRQQRRVLKREVDLLPIEARDVIRSVVGTHTAVNSTGGFQWDLKTIGIIFGALLLLLFLPLAFLVPYPSPFQLFVFRIQLALGTAVCAAAVPGHLKIKTRIPGGIGTISAGGALVAFVLVYLINPPALLYR